MEKPGIMMSPPVLRLASRFLAATALACWLAFVTLGLRYNQTKPTIPTAKRTHLWANHGHIVFLTLRENTQLNLLVGGAIFFFGTAGILDFIQRRQTAKPGTNI
jgi:hypothetical protein